MRNFFILLGHEVRMLLLLPATYLAAGLFLGILLFLYVLSIQIGGRELEDQVPVSLFFQGFFLPVCFMVPLITMRTLAEERRLGTLQSLLSTPATPLQIVCAKYLAAYAFYLAMWGLTLGFPVLLNERFPQIVETARLFDPAALAGGYAFVALTGLLYVAIGLFCSGLTRSQLVAGVLTFFLLFLLTFGPALLPQLLAMMPAEGATPGGGPLPMVDWLMQPLAFLQAYDHLDDFSRGIVDTRPIVLYLSCTALLVGTTVFNVEAKAGSPT
ncbi:MAG: ABC transporter permease [Opitutales bacterium]